MWVLKLQLESKLQFLGSMAMKHNISITGYPLSFSKEKKHILATGLGIIFGEEKDKKAFIKDLKKQPELVQMEFKDNFGIIIIKQPLFTESYYDSRIIHLSPVIINPKKKVHTWHLGSFDRKLLEKILKTSEKNLGAKLIKFKEESISNISFTKVLTELTKNQKTALEIAINNGYYDYPKKVKMEELAKKMKISYSTYQAHLKKAEGKIVPEVYREL